MPVCGCACVYRNPKCRRCVGLPAAAVIGGCQPPNSGAGSQIQVFCNHQAISQCIGFLGVGFCLGSAVEPRH